MLYTIVVGFVNFPPVAPIQLSNIALHFLTEGVVTFSYTNQVPNRHV